MSYLFRTRRLVQTPATHWVTRTVKAGPSVGNHS